MDSAPLSSAGMFGLGSRRFSRNYLTSVTFLEVEGIDSDDSVFKPYLDQLYSWSLFLKLTTYTGS